MTYHNRVDDFRIGERVQMHPGTDLWMRGARFGTVTMIRRKYVSVKLDALRMPVNIHPDNLMHVEG